MKRGRGKVYSVIVAIITGSLFLIGSYNDVLQFLDTLKQNGLVYRVGNFLSMYKKYCYIVLAVIIVILLILMIFLVYEDIHNSINRRKAEKVLQDFAKKLETTGDDVQPFISSQMEGIIAKNTKGIEAYNANKLREINIDPSRYEAFLAQKIARDDAPESCKKAYKILHEIVDSWMVFLNKDKQVIAYWIFVALKKDKYDIIKTGTVNEMDIDIQDIESIGVRGTYWGYLLLAGTIKNLRTPEVEHYLYDSWLNYIERLADKEKVYFEEISSMVGSVAGNLSLQKIGMEYYADYKFGGKMYRYDMKNIKKIRHLVENYGKLEMVYSAKFRNRK